jgi:hypothetical protein
LPDNARTRFVWYCDGERPNGMRCNQVLGVFEVAPIGEIKCRRCGHFSARTKDFPWNLDDRENRGDFHQTYSNDTAPGARDGLKEQPRGSEIRNPVPARSH